MKLAALLPMKGHSERVPNKNLKDFHGLPLYHRITTSLLKSTYVDIVVINTDSETIKKDAIKSFADRVRIIDRPESIQGNLISMNNIIEYDLHMLDSYTHFIQTHSTNPLLKTETIDLAIKEYLKVIENNLFDSLFSVTRLQTRFYWKTGEPVNHNPNELRRTQDLPVMYEENSNFYIFSRNSFILNEKKRIGKRPFLFEMDKIEATDIDEPEDFIIAEKLYTYE
jgi:CMP-N-acetylneuraminic acid synthetase